MNIRFYQKDGRIGAKYDVYGDDRDDNEDLCGLIRFCDHVESLFEGDIGPLPLDVQARGEESIRVHVEEACRNHHQQQVTRAKERRTASSQQRDVVNRVVQTKYRGLILKGRMKNYGTPKRFRLKLKKPFPFRKRHIFDCPKSFAGPMADDVFDWMTGELTDAVLQEAKDGLVHLFTLGLIRTKHAEAIRLRRALNEGG